MFLFDNEHESWIDSKHESLAFALRQEIMIIITGFFWRFPVKVWFSQSKFENKNFFHLLKWRFRNLFLVKKFLIVVPCSRNSGILSKRGVVEKKLHRIFQVAQMLLFFLVSCQKVDVYLAIQLHKSISFFFSLAIHCFESYLQPSSSHFCFLLSSNVPLCNRFLSPFYRYLKWPKHQLSVSI